MGVCVVPFVGKLEGGRRRGLGLLLPSLFLRGRRRGGGFSLRPLSVYAVELLRPAKSNKLCKIKFCFNFILKDQASISCLEVRRTAQQTFPGNKLHFCCFGSLHY